MPAQQASPTLPERSFWVAEDLDKFPVDNVRREIIGGALIVSPTPILRHQRCVFELGKRLDAAAPLEMEVMPVPCDWRPPGGDNFQPDVMVFRESDVDLEGPLRGIPLLVVEILSPSNAAYDTGWKRAAYERHRVPAYWIVDAKAPSVTVLRLDDGGRYVEAAQVTGDQRLTVDFPFPVSFTPAELLTRARSA